jgi:hypothetical protein
MQSQLAKRLEEDLIANAERGRFTEGRRAIRIQGILRASHAEQLLGATIVRDQFVVRDRPAFRQIRVGDGREVCPGDEVDRRETLQLRAENRRRAAGAAPPGRVEDDLTERGFSLEEKGPTSNAQPGLDVRVRSARDAECLGAGVEKLSFLEKEDALSAPGELIARAAPPHPRADHDDVPLLAVRSLGDVISRIAAEPHEHATPTLAKAGASRQLSMRRSPAAASGIFPSTGSAYR